MLGKGKLSTLIAFSAILGLSALVGFWAASTPVVAGDDHDHERHPLAYALSTVGLFGDRVFLGVGLEEETEYAEGGARVNRVIDGSAADDAGLQRGDIIVAFDGHTIRGPRGLTKQLEEFEPGESASITVVRDGREQSFDVELGQRKGFSAITLGDGNHFFNCDDENCENAFSFNFDFGGLMGRPLLGVQLVEVTDELREHLGGRDGEGVLVSKVVSGSPAEDAGIRVGDLIVGLDGDDVGSVGDLRQGLSGKQGETFDVDVIRDGRPESVRVTIPARESGAPSGPRAFYLAPQGFDELRQMLHDTRLQSREAIRQAGKASQDAARLYREAPRGADLRNSI